MVGMDAEKVEKSDSTMVLSLRGYNPDLQRSLVIHEFGHALGLEHEHQRSDFWEVLEKHLDTEKMMADPFVNPSDSVPEEGKAAFGRDWGQKAKEQTSGKQASSEYDPESIMHYW